LLPHAGKNEVVVLHIFIQLASSMPRPLILVVRILLILVLVLDFFSCYSVEFVSFFFAATSEPRS